MSSIRAKRLPVRIAARLTLAGALTVVPLAGLAAAAQGDIGATIIDRCTNGRPLGGFSQQAYSKALQEMPAEVSEYSDCANLIRKAQLAAAGNRAGASGAAGGGVGGLTASVAPPTPAEQQTLQRAHRAGAAPVQIDGQAVDPGVVHADIASAVSSLPTPLLALLAVLFGCALAIVGRTIRDRVRAGRSR